MKLPADLLRHHLAILGKTGSGKTYAAKHLVENILDDGHQICVVDPTSAWYGLRLGRDGKSKGYEVVLVGGDHGDIPLSERSGAAVARLVTEQRVSVVIDTGSLTVGEYTRWFVDFAGTLYATIRNPLHLVIDEAHQFMPQGKVPDPMTGKMLHAGNRLMSGGRSRGIRALLITQRPAKLHKDSLTCAETLISMKVIAPQDREAVKAWIDGAGDPKLARNVLDTLATLHTGEGWVWYPTGGFLERVKFPTIKTYDSSATPEGGKARAVKVSEIDLEAVRSAMADAVKEAEANDPKLLRQRIAELERAAREAKPVKAEPEIREIPALSAQDREAIDRAIGKAAELAEQSQAAAIAAQALIQDVASVVDGLAKVLQPASPPRPKTRIEIRPPVPPPPRRANSDFPENGKAGDLTGPQQAILDTILMLNTRGIDANRDSIARWLDIHPNGGSYGTNLSFLRSNGYLEGCRLTDKGGAAARATETGIDAALKALPDEPKRNIVRVLQRLSPLSRDELAGHLGIHPNGGSYGTNLGRLRTMGLITERGPIELTSGAFK